MGPDRILREEIIHRKLIVGVGIRKTNNNTGEGYEFCFNPICHGPLGRDRFTQSAWICKKLSKASFDHEILYLPHDALGL